jgi:hypothetical protein
MQRRHRWSEPNSSNPQTFLQISMLPPRPAAKLPSQRTWTLISTLPVLYKPPMPLRARQKSRQESAVSSNWMAAERGLSIAASRRTCSRCVLFCWLWLLSIRRELMGSGSLLLLTQDVARYAKEQIIPKAPSLEFSMIALGGGFSEEESGGV